VKLSQQDFDNFWRLMEHVDNFEISLPYEYVFYITYHSHNGKVGFKNPGNNQTGELNKEDFKRVFGKHLEIILSYMNDKKQPLVLPNELYVASIIRYYFMSLV